MPDHEPACTGTYTCTRCGEAKPALAFGVNKKNKSGLESWCRDCIGDKNRKYRSEKRRGEGRGAFASPKGLLPDGYE